jgi:hypothetical protein
MRKFVLLLAVAAMLALPGITMGQNVYLFAVEKSSGSNVIPVPPAPGTMIQIEVYSVSDVNLDGVQFSFSVNGGANDADLNTAAAGLLGDAPGRPTFPPTPVGEWDIGDYNFATGFGSVYGTSTPLPAVNAASPEVWATPAGSQVAAGTRFIDTYQVIYNGGSGVQVINLNLDVYGHGNSYIYGGGSSSGNYAPPGDGSANLTIMPEPATALLLIGALPFLRRRR